MVVRTQTPRLRQVRKTNLELIFSDHNAYCLPPCQNKCPSHIDIPGFLKANTEGNFIESARIFKRTIPFPSVLGRVCPAPCEEHCRRDEVEEAIADPRQPPLRRRPGAQGAGDAGIKAPVPFEVQPPTGKRAAVIGSGPAGMSAAYYLAIAGHEVTVFETRPGPRRHAPLRHPPVPPAQGGGARGEYQSVWDLGVQDRHATPSWAATSRSTTSRTRASTRSCVAIGCYDTNKLGVPGEDADGVLDGLEYLRIATLGLPVPGPRGQARRGHRRRLHLHGLHADLDPPGRQRR